jgi:hypothetical protein
MKRERMGECEVMRDEMTTRCPHSASTAAPTACSVCAPALSSVRAVCCLLGLGDGNVPKAREEWKKSRPRVGPRSECPRYRGNSFSFSFLPRDFCDGGIDRSTDSICAQYDLGVAAGQETRDGETSPVQPCQLLPEQEMGASRQQGPPYWIEIRNLNH